MQRIGMTYEKNDREFNPKVKTMNSLSDIIRRGGQGQVHWGLGISRKYRKAEEDRRWNGIDDEPMILYSLSVV